MQSLKKILGLSLFLFVGVAPLSQANDLARRSLQFDGIDDIVRVPFSETLALQDAMTAEAWIRPNETDEGGLISMWGGGLDPDKFILYLGNHQLIARIERAGGAGPVQIAAPLATDAWTHVAMTYDGLSLILYINGSMVNVLAAPGALADNDLDLRLGIDDISPTSVPSYYHGSMDEVRVWRYARTPNQMAIFYNQIIDPNTEGMVAYLQMNEAVGDQTVRDSSPVGNEGSLGHDRDPDVDDPQRQPTLFGGIRWESLGQGLAGSLGTPFLYGSGTLEAGAPTQFFLEGARPFSSVMLIMSGVYLGAPFLGGTLIPSPDFVVGGLMTNATGSLSLIGAWPVGVPSCEDFFFQMWIADSTTPAGFAGSNGVVAQTAQ